MATPALQNIYYKRAVATPRLCYMCNRETSTVLATLNTTDFLYTCDTHLTDYGFATLLDPPAEPSKPAISQAEIDKAKKEWEERQERKKAKEKEKEKEKSDDKKDDKDKEDKPKSPSPASPPPAAPTRTHQRYSLHRDVFAMRVAEQKRRRQTKAVKEVAPRLPGAPRSSLGNA
ncbi:DUF1742-domain-containing protein [Sistotremastrum niveocremeum HHB9708]|uniref:DUF1742-domain-containing protein n=1 Tax=Sistotremastrum niveocremeum HHB9708 TaxID=1314777 RepID=A0A164ZUM9_9AGAM|nr:DUF1742-domain-containing protein [Sistotremastrum niveocremeum HHB9708]